MSSRYDAVYARSIEDPDGFWAEAAEDVHWYKRWDKVLDDSRKPFYRWFAGGVTNSCYNVLDLHVESGRAEQPAIIYDSPVTNTIQTFTYRDLRDEVATFAGVLAAHGVTRGDRVLIYMPMIPQTVMAMLACARIGAIHLVVFGGYAANELATCIDDAKPKIIVSASCGIEVDRVIPYMPLVEQAVEIARHKPAKRIIVQREALAAPLRPGVDFDWDEEMAKASPAECVPVAATDPLYILYTSGTTGMPKGVVRDNGGYLVALKWSMKNIYDVDPGEVYWAASDIGWSAGHRCIVYGPLCYGCTSILYEGKPVGTPDPGVFWRVISQHKVAALFTAPTTFRAIKRDDPDADYMRKYDLSCLRMLFLSGEHSDPDTLQWIEMHLGTPVSEQWGQTETCPVISANCVGLGMLPVKPGSANKAVPGYRVQIVDDSANEVPRGDIGAIVVKLPLPPGCLSTLWNNDDGFVGSYLSDFPGFYKTGDTGFEDDDGYLWITSRTDDVVKVAGHRLSTGAMEEVLAAHPDVAECAVIGVADALKGQLPLGFLVLKAGVERDDGEIVREVVQMVRERIGPVAAFKTATVVKRLPTTRSGKILRGTMKKIADGEAYRVPATIDDPVILDEIGNALKEIGYPQCTGS